MAAKKKATTRKATTAKPTRKSSLRTPAAQSSDPAVQKLLADRQTAVMNQELLTIDEIDKQLAEMGLYA